MKKLKINTHEILRFWRERLSLCFNVSLFDISIIASLLKFDAATQLTKSACVFSLLFSCETCRNRDRNFKFSTSLSSKRVWSCGVNGRGF